MNENQIFGTGFILGAFLNYLWIRVYNEVIKK